MRKMVLMLPLLLLFAALQAADAVPFTVENKCGYTVWAAGLPGGGQEVPTGQSWTFEVAAGTQSGRLWGRTGCTFDANGQGSCQTGDCGRQLQCSLSGAPPTTLVEYTLNGNDAHNTDFYDISLIDGFNVPLSVYPTSGGCTTVNCNVDITSICPSDLQTAGGCLSACNKCHQDQYCCTGSYLDTCGPTNYSQFFKQQCPQAYTYAKEDRSSTSTCPSGGGYRIVFCG